MSKGFTLIESLISLILLTIIMVGGMSFYFYSKGAARSTVHQEIAAEIANGRMEEIINNSYAALPVPGAGLWQGPTQVQIANLTGNEFVYVNDVGGGSVIYKQLTVEILWSDPNLANQQRIVLDTYLAP